MWAGPYAGMLLASLGAEVIKVEGHRRSDLTRRSVIWPIQEPAPIVVPPNQGLAFNTVNMNKQGLAVDLSRPEGVEVARRLARVSDVVVDNMRPGAMVGLGLGWEDLRKVRADLVVATSSGRGFSGPEKNYLGFASVHQAIGGGAYVTGYADDAPCHSGGDVDLMNAMTLALVDRRRAPSSRPHRRGPVHRLLAVRGRQRVGGRAAARLPDDRSGPRAHGQRASVVGAARGLSGLGRRPLGGDRGPRRRGVRAARRRHRPARPRRRSAIRHRAPRARPTRKRSTRSSPAGSAAATATRWSRRSRRRVSPPRRCATVAISTPTVTCASAARSSRCSIPSSASSSWCALRGVSTTSRRRPRRLRCWARTTTRSSASSATAPTRSRQLRSADVVL